MVLSDMPFETSSLIHSRYSMLRRPDSAPVHSPETARAQISKEYAAFLKDQERKVGPDGFLDSNKLSHTFYVKKDLQKHKAQQEYSRPNVVKLKEQIEKDKKEHEQKMKVIEDHMWQHKQEERELKRTEGDIIKNQRSVKHMLRDYENVINKKRMTEEKKLNTGLEKYTVLRQDYVHQTHDLTKSRTQQNILFDHSQKDAGRKTAMTQSDLARSYRAKKSEMELKQIELMRLSQDFETKMRKKEQEQYKIKQQLADLAIALNMENLKSRSQTFEAQKEKKRGTTNRITEDLAAKQAVENKIARSDGDNKHAEMMKRKLSADLVLTKTRIAIKQRDEQRHLTDTRMRLGDNSNVQRQLNEAAFHNEMDMKSRQMKQNVAAHTRRRDVYRHTYMKQKMDTEQAKEKLYEYKFKKREADRLKLEHDDSVKFFQKMVSKGEEQEQNLYNKVRNAEYSRQKQEQTVRRLQQQINAAKKRNSALVKDEIAKRNKEEMELQQRLIREKAELDKMHAEREESYYTLQTHRHALNHDKLNLAEHQTEHRRLLQIGSHTDMVQASA